MPIFLFNKNLIDNSKDRIKDLLVVFSQMHYLKDKLDILKKDKRGFMYYGEIFCSQIIAQLLFRFKKVGLRLSHEHK